MRISLSPSLSLSQCIVPNDTGSKEAFLSRNCSRQVENRSCRTRLFRLDCIAHSILANISFLAMYRFQFEKAFLEVETFHCLGNSFKFSL